MCQFKICYICFEQCYLPANLPLKCQCRYSVHYDCIYIWYGRKRTCIICKKYVDPPLPHILEDICYTICEIFKYFKDSISLIK